MRKISIFLYVCFITNFVSAQDFLITFSGIGESNTVSSVIVENLTQNKSLTLIGSDVLHLKKVVTGISDLTSPDQQNIRFYPNPALDYSLLQFSLIEEGTVNIDLFDSSGRVILQKSEYLTSGNHSYCFTGLVQGIYIVRITSGAKFLSGKLVCEKSLNGNLGIALNDNLHFQRNQNDLKSANAETSMQYNTGDILKFTGISGKFKTVVTDIPTGNKTIAFSFNYCLDADGNNYSIVKIGNQWWMAENLQTTKYRNGDLIQLVKDSVQWRSLTTGAYCNYKNDLLNSATYGRLYNWYSINDSRKVCPVAWRVATDADWSALIAYLGATNAGNKLKETGTSHWQSSNNATNETGFTALPSGRRDYNASWGFMGSMGYWWSSDEYNADNANYFYMTYGRTDVSKSYTNKTLIGFSVRCIRE